VGLQVVLTAQLVIGPGQVSDSYFPSGSTTIPIFLNPTPKTYAVDTGPQRPQVNSPSAFVALSGIGSGQTVTQASYFYFRCQTPVQLKITYLGDATQYIRYVNGVVMEECDPTHPITSVQIQGSGQVEYWACGLQ